MLNIRDDGQIHQSPINIDGLSDDELQAIATSPAIHQEVKRYAALHVKAREHRKKGNILTARKLEQKADAVYERIPAHLKW